MVSLGNNENLEWLGLIKFVKEVDNCNKVLGDSNNHHQQLVGIIAVIRSHFNQKFSSSICKYLFLNEDL